MPSRTGPSIQTVYDADIDVRGVVPPALSGRLLGIQRGVVHSVDVRSGGAVFYRSRPTRPVVHVRHVVAFNGTTLAFGDGLAAFELSTALDTLRPVDLAGQGRPLAPFPKHDPTTGDLHVIAGAVGATQAHVVISAGALTRRYRPIADTPNRIDDLALTRDGVVFLSDGFVGIASREGEGRTTWIETGLDRVAPVHACDVGDAVVLVALTPRLERWTLRPAAATIHREVLDPTPRRFAHPGNESVDGPAHMLWTTGNGTIGHHDLVAGRNAHVKLAPNVPGDFAFVADSTRPSESGGWLIGFVHDAAHATTELRVIDASDIAAPPIAAAPLPRPIDHAFRCTWIPSTQ